MVVIAQLIINSKSYGLYLFVVQIRDIETYKLLENIYVDNICYGRRPLLNPIVKLSPFEIALSKASVGVIPALI